MTGVPFADRGYLCFLFHITPENMGAGRKPGEQFRATLVGLSSKTSVSFKEALESLFQTLNNKW